MDTLRHRCLHTPTDRQTCTISVSWLTGRMLPEDKRPHSRHLPQKPLQLCPLSVRMTSYNINISHTGKKKISAMINCGSMCVDIIFKIEILSTIYRQACISHDCCQVIKTTKESLNYCHSFEVHVLYLYLATVQHNKSENWVHINLASKFNEPTSEKASRGVEAGAGPRVTHTVFTQGESGKRGEGSLTHNLLPGDQS